MLNRFSLGLKHKKNNVPVLSQRDIEYLAKTLINEYSSDLLRVPNALDVDDFTEFFLELDIEYHHLSNNNCYFGMYVFNDSDRIPVYYPWDNTVRELTNKERTILLDSDFDGTHNETLRRFTLLHECSHALLHRRYFERTDEQLALFDFNDVVEEPEIQMHAAFVSRPIQSQKGRRKLETEHDWIEWQANTLASCLLMNETAMLSFLEQFDVHSLSSLQTLMLEHKIANHFDVSYEAAKVRLDVILSNQLNTGTLL